MEKFIKKILLVCFGITLVLGFSPLIQTKASAAVNPNYTILDSIFQNKDSMSASQIDSKINNYYPSSCISTLSGFGTEDPLGFSNGAYQLGSRVSAGQAIYDIAQHYNVSPQVILTTLQKEQSVVTGSAGCHPNSPDSSQSQNSPCGTARTPCTTACPFSGGCIPIAMSYACPNYCYAGIEGFSNQLSGGTWVLRFAEERAYGILTGYSGYDSGDENLIYTGPLTPGQRQRVAGGTVINSDGTWTSSDGVSLTITNGGTASLYNYTPFANDTNFESIFSNTFGFGPLTSPCYNDTNISGAISGEHVIPNKLGINHTDNLSLTQANNSGSGCFESYTWQNNNYNVWRQLTASVSPVFNPATSSIVAADTNGDGLDEIYKVDYTGTGSGRIEIHGFTSNLQGFSSHVATIQPSISHSDAEIVACDPAGYGHDNFFLVNYRNTATGDIEIHEWAPGLQQWVNHWDTHYGAVSPQNNQIVCGDLNGSGKDAFYFVQYVTSGSGRLEIHGGITNLGYNTPWPYASPAQWPVHSATISGPRTHWEGDTSASADDTDLIMADTNGDAKDEVYIVQYHGTSSGRVEIYGLTPNFQNYSLLTTTNQGSY